MVDSLSDTTWAARALLENFELVGTRLHMAMVSRDPHMKGFREDVQAAAIASTLGLKSVDYAKKRYGKSNSQIKSGQKALGAYLSAYQATKRYVDNMIEKFNSEGRPDPTNGAYGASLVLE